MRAFYILPLLFHIICLQQQYIEQGKGILPFFGEKANNIEKYISPIINKKAETLFRKLLNTASTNIVYQYIQPKIMAIPAKSINEVLAELDRIIENTIVENNYLVIFAYVYRRTTAQIKQAIAEKQFEDNDRMELMDVAFANLYLTAYQNYTNNQSCSASWEVAFRAKFEKITIIQHLMLGMNAHINMDLGIVAATFSPGSVMPALKNDFMKVNQILNGLTNEMQDRIAKVSRLMIVLDWIGKNTDELIVNFSMVKAREQAWNLASILSDSNHAEQESVIGVADVMIAGLGANIKSPPGKLLNIVLKFIGYFEEKNVKTIITKLEENQV